MIDDDIVKFQQIIKSFFDQHPIYGDYHFRGDIKYPERKTKKIGGGRDFRVCVVHLSHKNNTSGVDLIFLLSHYFEDFTDIEFNETKATEALKNFNHMWDMLPINDCSEVRLLLTSEQRLVQLK